MSRMSSAESSFRTCRLVQSRHSMRKSVPGSVDAAAGMSGCQRLCPGTSWSCMYLLTSTLNKDSAIDPPRHMSTLDIRAHGTLPYRAFAPLFPLPDPLSLGKRPRMERLLYLILGEGNLRVKRSAKSSGMEAGLALFSVQDMDRRQRRACI